MRTTRRKEGKTIRDRPEGANTREEFGHWEMDLVEGVKKKNDPFLLVLTERQTRQEIIEKIPNKRSKVSNKRFRSNRKTFWSSKL